MASSRSAARRSLTAKIQLYLANSSRDMSTYTVTNPARDDDGHVIFTHLNETYKIGTVKEDEDFLIPGVNVTFVDEIDLTADRTKAARYLLTAIIRVTRPIGDLERPSAVEVKVLELMDKVLDALSDRTLEIWDYSGSVPTDTKKRGYWKTPIHPGRYRFADESAVVPGGDIRHSVLLSIEYAA